MRPASIGAAQVAGVMVGVGGAALALWCITTFVVIGRGTPAPFDPPRRLVIAGPYRLVRNPMYIGAGLALGGAALFYESSAILGYCAAFLVVMHLFVVLYEESALRASFGEAYSRYCRDVHRWLPSFGHRQSPESLMKVLGIVLIVLGALGLLYGGFSYTRRRETVSLGPLSATVTQRESVPIPPILGGIAVLAGITLLLVGGKKRS